MTKNSAARDAGAERLVKSQPAGRAKIQIDNRRAVDEWIGAHPDQAIPERVKARIFARCEGKCGLTGKKIRVGEGDFDHIKSLRNGGEHRESNLHVVWRPAHREKTAQENSDGAKADRTFAKHHGFHKTSSRKIPARVDPWGKGKGQFSIERPFPQSRSQSLSGRASSRVSTPPGMNTKSALRDEQS